MWRSSCVYWKQYAKAFSYKSQTTWSPACKRQTYGVQFDALFTDDLYLEIGKNAIETAAVLKAGLKEKGYTFYIDSPTNQQFVVLENRKMEELKKNVQFSFWEKKDDTHTVVRFATSWATRMEDVEKLLSLL